MFSCDFCLGRRVHYYFTTNVVVFIHLIAFDTTYPPLRPFERVRHGQFVFARTTPLARSHVNSFFGCLPSTTLFFVAQPTEELCFRPGKLLKWAIYRENVPSKAALSLHLGERESRYTCAALMLIYSLQRQNVPASGPAQTAAAQAFLASRSSSANLSMSAAAAALRTMSPTPTPVSGVQTKRMLQRQGSNGSDAGELGRRNSSGSMTERTFRTPSPNRPEQSMDPGDAPPVPPVPKAYNNDASHRRAASMEPTKRVVSPPPTKRGGRFASLDRAPVSSQTKPQNQRQTSLTNVTDLERTGSGSSINFSYPTGARPNSPPAQRSTPRSQNHATDGISQETVNNIQHVLVETAAQPVKKKKKRVATGSAEGSHLATGGKGGKPFGASVGATRPDTIEPEQAAAEPAKKSQMVTNRTSRQTDSLSSDGSDSDSTPETFKDKRTQRASGALTKQPSVVREDWEGEQEHVPQGKTMAEERADAGLSPVGSPSNVQSRKETVVLNTSKKTTESPDHSMQETRQVPQLITNLHSTTVQPRAEIPSSGQLEVIKDTSRPTRQSSISPSRSTRFSAHLASDFTGQPRHEPPPRSVSPAKSALKHPSPSPQSASPIDGAAGLGWRRTSQASSETSDNVSTASADGLGPRSQRKKSVRVSFEADPEIVGAAADVPPSDTPILTSPQNRNSMNKGRLGLSKSSHLDAIPAEDDMEEVMKPRPVLPSFGSVRGRRDGSAERTIPVVEAVSPSSSSSSSSSNLATMDTSISSDHAIGGILAREMAKSQSEAKPPIPKATHALTTVPTAPNPGYESKRQNNEPFQRSTDRQGDSLFAPNIPSIAIQPATPGIGEIGFQDQWLVAVPGGFPAIAELEGDVVPSQAAASTSGSRELSTSSPADLGISEPKPSERVYAEDPSIPQVGSVSESLRQQTHAENDRESESSSIYSDAAEDLSDLEGDGFGSINAIIESPIVGPPPMLATPPDSPLAGKPIKERIGARNRQSSWEETQAHWKSLADRQRSTDPSEQTGQDATQPRPRKKKTRRATEENSQAKPSGSSTLVLDSPQRTLPQSSPYPVMTDKRASSTVQGPMRRSMRDQPSESTAGTGFRTSMRPKKSPESQARGTPPSSLPKGALQKKRIPASPSAPAPVTRAEPKPNLAPSRRLNMVNSRRLSNDSDSSSSFKRSKRPASSGGKYTMRRSMRSGSVDERPTSPPAPTGGVRSRSPQNSRPFSPLGQGTMRSTMRGSVDAGVPSLRKQEPPKRPSVIYGFGKSRNKAKDVPSKPLTSKLKSRFADSDDEDARPQTYRSRFEDSSDEEPEMIKYRPVRGIPGKANQEDSTDLEDSSDEGQKTKAKSKRQSPKSPDALNGLSPKPVDQEPAVSTTITSPPLSPEDSPKRGSIFGRFRSKKAKDSSNQDIKTQPAITISKQEKEKNQEQARADLEDHARSPVESPTPPTEMRGKLQRRHTPQRLTSDSWPLPPPKPAFVDDGRPSTSDGTAEGLSNGLRPGLGPRPDSSGTLSTQASAGGTPVLGRSGKKKRFPMLRKAFGLHD